MAHLLKKVLRTDMGLLGEKEETATENKMYRRMPTRQEKSWTESGRWDGQGVMEKKDHRTSRQSFSWQKQEEMKSVEYIAVKSVVAIAFSIDVLLNQNMQRVK